jgi:hypothetical protein
MRKLLGSNVLTLAALSLACLALPGLAGEFPAGEPIERHGMKIAGVYLQPVEMEPAIAGQEAGHADIHLEADIHATAANPNGLGEGDWIPYLRIAYTLGKEGSDWSRSGMLHAMVASDGPHYGANVALEGPGRYRVTFRIQPPAPDHFLRHIDAETGVAPWWNTIDYTGEFNVIGTGKKGDY